MSDQTQVSKPEAKETPKKVKIRALRPILVDRHVDKFGVVQGTVVNPGQEVTVSESDAKMFCESEFPGHFAFSGHRSGDESKHPCIRAVRVQEKAA